mgnify:FL=1
MSYSRKSKSRAGLSIKQKDETLVMNGTITSDMLIKERDFYMSNKGARTKSVRDRITRIESVIVARERILTEMLTKKKKEESKDDVPSK